MANTPSAIKRVRQNEKRRNRNRGQRSKLRTEIKKLRLAIDASDAEKARELMPATVSLVDVMIKKGILHENTGNRYKSRLASRLASLAS